MNKIRKSYLIIGVITITLIVTHVVNSTFNNIDSSSPFSVSPAIPFDYFYFGNTMNYRFHIIENDQSFVFRGETMLRIIWPESNFFNPHLQKFIIVSTEEEARTFPYYVVAGFPDPNRYQEGIDFIHWVVENQNMLLLAPIHYEQFGLSYPVTFNDLVDNWMNVKRLWESIGRSILMPQYNSYIIQQRNM